MEVVGDIKFHLYTGIMLTAEIYSYSDNEFKFICCFFIILKVLSNEHYIDI